MSTDRQRPDHRPELLPGDRRLRRLHPGQRVRPGRRDGGGHHAAGRARTARSRPSRPWPAEQGARPVAGPDGAAGLDPGQDVGLVQRHHETRASCCPTGRTTARTARSSCTTRPTSRSPGSTSPTAGRSKIATDQLSVDSNDPVKETITLTIESPRAGQVSLTTRVRVHAPARVRRPRRRTCTGTGRCGWRRRGTSWSRCATRRSAARTTRG